MKFLEKDLEQIVFEANNEYLKDRGLEIDGKKKRQLNVGKYGVADLVTIKRFKRGDYLSGSYQPEQNCFITVYELKKDVIDDKTLVQSIRYALGISDYLKQRRSKIYPVFRLVLIGKTIKSETLQVIKTYFQHLEVYQYYYDIDGLRFKSMEDFSVENSKH